MGCDLKLPTNLGAIFRGAAALGMDAVLPSPSCADPPYRRSRGRRGRPLGAVPP
jgi:tRNA G18 (ribose-2'-O)-methylase SpoU